MSWFHIELNNWLTIYIYIFATENLGNSNLGSLYSDFFFLHFFSFQPMIQKIGSFHSFAINTSRASKSRISRRRKKKRLLGVRGMAGWVRREVWMQVRCEEQELPAVPRLRSFSPAEAQKMSLPLPLSQNAIRLKISFNLEPCRV